MYDFDGGNNKLVSGAYYSNTDGSVIRVKDIQDGSVFFDYNGVEKILNSSDFKRFLEQEKFKGLKKGDYEKNDTREESARIKKVIESGKSIKEIVSTIKESTTYVVSSGTPSNSGREDKSDVIVKVNGEKYIVGVIGRVIGRESDTMFVDWDKSELERLSPGLSKDFKDDRVSSRDRRSDWWDPEEILINHLKKLGSVKSESVRPR